jgi:hypothetical protein
MAEAATLLPILRDAEEGDERIQATFLDPACVAYAARVDGLLIGAAVMRWDEHEGSELLYIAVIVFCIYPAATTRAWDYHARYDRALL